MRATSLIAVFVLATFARAELPSPRLDRITPLGAAAGSSVELEIAGPDLDEVTALRFDHPGLTAEHVKDRKFRVRVAADVPEATYDVRAVGKYGVSSPRLFAVSRGMTEAVKKTGNADREAAQPVAVNTVVNGTTDGGREDFYRFPAKAGQRVVVECRGQQLDSPLDATLALTDDADRPLAANGDTIGRDPLVDFVAPKDGEYVVAVADLSFRGGLPYRLLVTDRPHVENTFPRAVQAGKPAGLTVYGRNLGPRAKPSAWAVNDLPLDERAETVTPPADLFARGAYRFDFNPSAHSVLPTAATCTLTGFQYCGVPLVVTDTPVTPEAEPNDDPAKPQPLALPAVVSGRFDRPRDADWYEFETAGAGPYWFDVYCERIAGRADPYLVVLDPKGNRVGELDDYGHQVNAFIGHLRDPSGVVNLNAKTKYRVLVQDRYRRGGARYQYVLSVREPVPDFYAAAIHSQNPGPAGVNVRRGGATSIDIIIHAVGGFAGTVMVTADGLPKGVHATPAAVTGDNRGTVVLWADPDAADWVGPVTLTATAKTPAGELRRDVRPYTRVSSDANPASSRPTRELILAVRGDSPFGLKAEPRRVEIEAGKKFDVKLSLDRRWPDFKGAVTVIPLGFPGPFKTGTLTIAEGKAEATATIEVQANTRPGEYTLAVLGQGQVPFVKDAKDKSAKGGTTLVGQPSTPVTVVVTAPAKK